MVQFKFSPRGTCSREIRIALEGDIVENIEFIGGCGGNTSGIASLCKGMKIDDVISKLDGIDCGGKGTSCPNELARALKQHKLSGGK